ncbi:MAG TPA: BRO family protein [Planctomycetota bacterium]|nr:BRO family protein [Planctomycetota bacterium]
MAANTDDTSRALTPHGVFHFDEDRPSFDDLAQENGERRWSARQLMDLLGYSSWPSFKQVINRAATACMTIGASVADNFVEVGADYKLSKFACYLVAMNGDPKKPAVAAAQAYFAVIADAFQKYIESADDVARVEIRQRVTDHEKSLCSAASAHGVENYAFFKDEGYRGLYNMRLSDLRRYKGDPSKGARPLFDFMGRREMAANLFRLTETEARIENEKLKGQRALENAAFNVGRAVRKTMMQSGGQAPENLRLETDIKHIRGDLKRTLKGLKGAEEDRAPKAD